MTMIDIDIKLTFTEDEARRMVACLKEVLWTLGTGARAMGHLARAMGGCDFQTPHEEGLFALASLAQEGLCQRYESLDLSLTRLECEIAPVLRARLADLDAKRAAVAEAGECVA